MTYRSENQHDSEVDLLSKFELAMKTMEIPDGPSDAIMQQTLSAVHENVEGDFSVESPSQEKHATGRRLAGFGTLISAAVLLIAFVSIFQPQKTLAFEDLAKPFKNARTLVYETTMVLVNEREDQKIKSKLYFKEPGLSRIESNHDTVVVHDEIEGVTLFLFEKSRRATLVKGTPDPKFDFQNPDVLTPIQWLKMADTSGKTIAARTIDGIEAVGFAVEMGPVQMKIWGDPRTKQPLLIEIPIKSTGKDYLLSMTKFDFDKELSDDLFSVEPPEDFQVTVEQTPQIDSDRLSSLNPEEHVQRFLEFYSNLHGGEFPDQIDNPGLITEITQKLFEDGQLSDQEKLSLHEISVSIGHIWTYRDSLAEFHYQRNVKPGAHDQPVFWYRPVDSTNFKVVFGDLRIGELTVEDIDSLIR